jgi:hypothetical protein
LRIYAHWRVENKWALQGKEAQGTLHLTIKYRDVNSISKPAQFVKDQSVTSTGGAIITSNLRSLPLQRHTPIPPPPSLLLIAALAQPGVGQGAQRG